MIAGTERSSPRIQLRDEEQVAAGSGAEACVVAEGGYKAGRCQGAAAVGVVAQVAGRRVVGEALARQGEGAGRVRDKDAAVEMLQGGGAEPLVGAQVESGIPQYDRVAGARCEIGDRVKTDKIGR